MTTRRRSGVRVFDGAEERTPQDRQRGHENRVRAFREMVRMAAGNRRVTAKVVGEWHRTLFDGLSIVPDPCYLGGYRGSAHPWLVDYEVVVGMHDGVPAKSVGHQVDLLVLTLGARIADLARAIAQDHQKSAAELERVAELAAWLHGEWVRIHPFANGNGRVARLLANYVLARFRIAPALRLKPRPGPTYEAAARASMRGDHSRMTQWVLELLRAR